MKLIPILSSYTKAAVDRAERCFSTSSPVEYERLDQHIRRIEDMAREAFQEEYKKRYEAIAQRLEQAQPLSQEDKKALELLVVGEAQYYLKEEKEFQSWQDELQRIIHEIERLEAHGLNNEESLMRLQALCRDARSILPDITFYIREQERVENFQASMKGNLDPQAGHVLADIIRGMLSSEKM